MRTEPQVQQDSEPKGSNKRDGGADGGRWPVPRQAAGADLWLDSAEQGERFEDRKQRQMRQ